MDELTDEETDALTLVLALRVAVADSDEEMLAVGESGMVALADGVVAAVTDVLAV